MKTGGIAVNNVINIELTLIAAEYKPVLTSFVKNPNSIVSNELYTFADT